MAKLSLVGLGAWFLYLIAAGGRGTAEMEIALLFLLGPLVVVPLGIHLTWRILGDAAAGPFDRWLRILWAPCALLAVLSFVPPKLPISGILTLPWLGFTALLALSGFLRFLSRDLRKTSLVCLDVAWMFIPVGAGWLFLSRYGIEPMDFSPEIVLLTAVHFHFAGFGLPILLACWATQAKPSEKFLRPLGWTILAGIPALAFGITASPLVEVVSAWVLAIAVNVFGIKLMLHAMTAQMGVAARCLIFFAGAAGSAALVLSGVYAVGAFIEKDLITIPWMARTHGVLNAFGLVGGGLLGFVLNPLDRGKAP